MARRPAPPTPVELYAADFHEEPGYLDFPRLAPVGEHALAESRAMHEVLERARFGMLSPLAEQDARARTALAALLRVRDDQIVLQPSTSQGLMHVMFGLTGTIAASPHEFPAVGYAIARASEALGVLSAHALVPDHERVTPGVLREQLHDAVSAVVVSLVDYHTGHLVDLEGIRQVIGDRMLIVDAVQGAGIVDAPWELCDVIAGGGQKWLRAGPGTGYLVISDRAREQLTPVWSGWNAHESGEVEHDVLPPRSDAGAFRTGLGDPFAEARLAGAVEAVLAAGVPAIHEAVLERTARIIALADEVGLEVASPRDDAERAGIVSIAPHPEQLSGLAAALHNHGVSATVRGGRLRLGAHVSTSEETFEQLREAFAEWVVAARG